MEVARPKMAVAGRHLDGGMTQDTAQVVQVAASLGESGREGVAQVVPPDADDLRSAAGGVEPLLHVSVAGAVLLVEQVGRLRPTFLSQESLDGRDGSVR